jgi:branched-chain amino acid aminotransferase
MSESDPTGGGFKILEPGAVWAARAKYRRPWHDGYYAMYSSVWGGCVLDPFLMQVPADDHLVHRGDGVFETVKCVAGAVYALPGHLARLEASARAIGLSVPWSETELRGILLRTLAAGGSRDALARILLSRGPGSFGVSPADCPRTELYVIVYRLPPSFMEAHPEGARAIRSRIPAKPPCLATNKTCNYLPNALMKKEALDAGADFALGFDGEGWLAESSTENAGLVTREGELWVPEPGRILEGITMERVMKLAGNLPGGLIRAIRRRNISESALQAASEILIFGTTPDVTSVVRYEGRPVGIGRPGPVRAALQALLANDILRNPDQRTAVDWDAVPLRGG